MNFKCAKLAYFGLSTTRLVFIRELSRETKAYQTSVIGCFYNTFG